MITLKDSLLMDRYTEAEAEKQIKAGAVLYDLASYIDVLRENGLQEEIEKFSKENLMKYGKGCNLVADGISVIIQGEEIYILEKSL